MIYCVVPPELEDELYDKLVEYYKDNPNVTVIIDRRTGPTAAAGRRVDGAQERDDPRPAPARAARHVPGDRRPG